MTPLQLFDASVAAFAVLALGATAIYAWLLEGPFSPEGGGT